MHPRDMTITEAGRALDTSLAADVPLHMEEEAFRGFYDRTSRPLWSYLYRITGDRHAADDLVQESYYRFLRSDTALENDRHRRHYLFRIATNLVRDRFRRTAVRPVHVPHDEMVASGHERPLDATLDRRLDIAERHVAARVTGTRDALARVRAGRVAQGNRRRHWRARRRA